MYDTHSIQLFDDFTSKETRLILSLSSDTKASQAMNPAWEKVAKHAVFDLERTLAKILRDRRELIERMRSHTPMPDDEIENRRLLLEGKLSLSDL